VDFKLIAYDTLLERPSPSRSIISILEIQIIWKSLRANKPKLIKTGSPTSANVIYAAMNVSFVLQHISSIDLSQCKDYSVLVEQELPTLPEHLSSPPDFSGVLCVCFAARHLSFCPFSFGHCVVCPSSSYGFELPILYLQTLLHSENIGKPNDMKVLESK
jgi:hypothetical protein